MLTLIDLNVSEELQIRAPYAYGKVLDDILAKFLRISSKIIKVFKIVSLIVALIIRAVKIWAMWGLNMGIMLYIK